MALYSIVTAIGDGSTKIFNVTFPYLSKDHVKVFVDGVEVSAFTWLDDARIELTTAPPSGAIITIKRETPKDKKVVDFSGLAVLSEEALDLNANYNRFIVQEAFDALINTISLSDDGSMLDAQGLRIGNVAAPEAGTDAVNKDWVLSQPYISIAAAEEARIAAEEAQTAAETARDTITSYLPPTIQLEDAGRGLVVNPDGTSFSLGGTAASLDSGDAPENVATNGMVEAKVSEPIPSQAIIAALTGMRPDGWGPQDCDAPVCSILADRILPHTTYWSPAGSVPAVGFRDSKPEYAPFAETPSDWEYSVSATPPPAFGYDHHVERTMSSVTIGGAAAANFYGLKDFTITIDGVVVKTVTNESVWAANEKRTYTFTATAGKALRIVPTALIQSGSGTYFRLGSFAVGYTDVATGSVLIPAGLQVSYADSGKVKLSEVLGAAVTVDLVSAADGYHYLYGNLDADGAFASFGFSEVPMDVGIERKGFALLPAFTGYTLAGWGTVSATSYLTGSTNYAWKAFDGLNGTNDCWVADNAVDQSITLTPTKPRRITAIGIRSRNDANRGDLKDFRIVADGVTVATFTGVSWIANELKMFAVDAKVTSTLSIVVDAITKSGSASWTAPSIGEIIPYFAEDLFNPTTQKAVDVDNQPIRRVPLGSVVKSGGKLVAVNCYALGTVAIVPANNGNTVTAASYSVDNPFGDYRAIIDSDYWCEDYSPYPTWVHHANDPSWMNLVGGRRRTTLTNKAYSWSYRAIVEYNTSGNGTTPRVRIIFKRSY